MKWKRPASSNTPDEAESHAHRRITNLKQAYQRLRQHIQPGWTPTLETLQQFHRWISEGLPDMQPGLLRDNPKHEPTVVGDAEHGGRYRPPQYGRDIQQALNALLQWHDALRQHGIPALIRAPLVHLYFEQIHPFWDGNGRVGRLLETAILFEAGFEYAPFAHARFYLQHLDRYFTLFNLSRKQAEKKHPHPNHAFVNFFLQGMLEALKQLHHRVHQLTGRLVRLQHIQQLEEQKRLNTRQAHLMRLLLTRSHWSLHELDQDPALRALYATVSDRTRRRDLNRLRDLQLIRLEAGRIQPV